MMWQRFYSKSIPPSRSPRFPSNLFDHLRPKKSSIGLSQARAPPELWANHQQHSFAGCQASAAADRLSEHFDERVDQANAHGRDRVRNVAFRPQGGILWVDNLRVAQTSGVAWRDEVLRGESSPSRRPGIRRLRCTSWRDDGSRANRALQSAQARPPA